jgi:hypothetical protein
MVDNRSRLRADGQTPARDCAYAARRDPIEHYVVWLGEQSYAVRNVFVRVLS